MQLLPPACVYLSVSSNKTFWLWNPWCISHLGKCYLLLAVGVFFFFFLFLRSTAISVFCPLPLILLAQSFKDPFHFFSGLGFQTSPDFFKDRVFIFVSFPPSCQGEFQEKTEKGWLSHVQILRSSSFPPKRKWFYNFFEYKVTHSTPKSRQYREGAEEKK